MNRFLALSLLPAVMAQNYLGCYDEAVGARALTGAVTYDFAAMVPSECETFCTVNNTFAYYGVEYSGECYCGDSLSAGSLLSFESLCTIPCPGDATQICGGNGHLSLYGVTADVPVETAVPTTDVTAPVYVGCYTEAQGVRALPDDSEVDYTYMTNEICAHFCLFRGYLFFGTEYGGECYCGTALPTSDTAPEGDCSMPCDGNSAEICGAGNRLSVYQWE